MMSSPPNGHNIPTSGGGGGSVTGSLHDHHGSLLMQQQQQQQQQQQLDYYQNPNAIYNQIQQSHYGNTTGPGGAADHLLTTQQYLQSLHIADMPQLMTDGSEYSDYLQQQQQQQQQQQHYHVQQFGGVGDYGDVATAAAVTTTTSTANIVEDVDLDLAAAMKDAYGNYYGTAAGGPNMVPAHFHHHYQPQQYLVQYGTVVQGGGVAGGGVGVPGQQPVMLEAGGVMDPAANGQPGSVSGGVSGGGGSSSGDGTRWRNPNLVEVINFLKSPNNLIKANAAAYLQHLCYMDDPNKAKTRQLGGIPPLIELLKNDNFIVYRNALGALRNLSYGRQNDENKRQIKNYSGIAELMALLVKLQGRVVPGGGGVAALDDDLAGGGRKQLTPAMEMEIKELITGIIWNMSSCEDIKRTIIDDSVDAIVQLIIIPYSGILAPNSSSQAAQIFATSQPNAGGGQTDASYLATVFRNATGIIRNISSAGEYARQKLRETPFLINTLVHIIKTGIERQNIGNKIIENCVCILRNLSYRLQEIEDPNYDKLPIPLSNITGTASTSGEFLNSTSNQSFQNCNGTAAGASGSSGAAAASSSSSSSSGSHLGCFGVSKKKKQNKEKLEQENKNKNGSVAAGVGARGDGHSAAGGGNIGNNTSGGGNNGSQSDRPGNKNYETLFQPELIQFYLQLLQSCSNPETLEAAAGAIQNLAACYWQPSIEIRAAVRKEKGLPILVELLRMEVDRVVCAVATSLRNLAIDQRNKELIGKYAMRDLIQKLPTGNVSHDQGTSDDTIAAVLATLNEVIKKNCEFCRSLLENGGVERLMIIVKQKKQNYTPRVLKFTGQLLYTMWQHQDLRDAYKKCGWKESDFVHLQQSSASNTLAKSKASGGGGGGSSNSSASNTLSLHHSGGGGGGGGGTSASGGPAVAHHQQSPNSPPQVGSGTAAYGTTGSTGSGGGGTGGDPRLMMMGNSTLNRPMASQGGTRYEDRTIKRQNGGQPRSISTSNNSNYQMMQQQQHHQRNGGMTNEEIMMMHQQMAAAGNYQEIGGAGANMMLYQQQMAGDQMSAQGGGGVGGGGGGGGSVGGGGGSGSISHY